MRRRDPDLLRLLKYEYDCCDICGVTEPLHLHHVLLRSQGGDDVRANIICLCMGCHDDYHRNSGTGARRRVAEYVRLERPDTIAYMVEKLGEGAVDNWFALRNGG